VGISLPVRKRMSDTTGRATENNRVPPKMPDGETKGRRARPRPAKKPKAAPRKKAKARRRVARP
jgi:hypothetical protein